MVVHTPSWHSETVTFTLHMKGCRAAKMTLEQPSEAARKAGLARWAQVKKRKPKK
jgi:hypothetical protein